MWLHAVIIFLSATTHMTTFVTARFCEGGHICSLPRECCTQGCCPPYQSGPRQLPPPSEHVLNLFFISHWFFWCVVVAIILAILCAYSLWRKRRTLCGWGFSDHHAQSEGDSAGSCYAPPQYSRCNSFHHPPPPYTEVTSKPDLYPLVFTCNSDNGKSGSSYLMVQYFRNYIVRPAVAGSLSAASTIDSLSSSFICNANEANTLVPPPYSRAASPEVGGFTTPHYPLHQHHHHQAQQQQQHSNHQPAHLMHHSSMMHHSSAAHQHHAYMMPRSASQLVCPSSSAAGGRSATPDGQSAMEVAAGSNLAGQQVYQQHARLVQQQQHHQQQQQQHYAVISMPATHHMPPACHSQVTESEPDVATQTSAEMRTPSTGFAQSQSDQHFRYLGTSNSSISDIFVNAAATAAAATATTGTATCPPSHNPSIASALEGVGFVVGSGSATSGGTPVIFSNGRIKPHPLHRTSTNPTQFVASAEAHREPVYTSLNSIAVEGGDSSAELHRLRHSLEACNWQLLQYQAATGQGGGGHTPHPGSSAAPNGPASTYGSSAGGDSPLRMHELGGKKFAGDEGLRSYLTSGSCSAVSSLANIGTPSSPPQATSPTGEVKELLDQIRQLHEEASYDDLLEAAGPARPALQHTVSSPAAHATAEAKGGKALKRFSTMSESRSKTSLMSPTTSPRGSSTRYSMAAAPQGAGATSCSSKRPATLQQSAKKKFCSPKPNKAMYIPMAAAGSGVSAQPRGLMKSPVGANFFGSRGSRVRKAWISRSAPTTPGTNLPPNRLGDDSPLLNEHDEEFDEQIAEIE